MPVSQRRDKTSKTQSAVGLPPGYAALHGSFGWQVPQHFNMAQACSQRWLQAQANRLSNALRVLGVQRGDRVGIVLPQRFETAVAYMAVLQLGAVAM
eukprot:gene36139-59187_t